MKTPNNNFEDALNYLGIFLRTILIAPVIVGIIASIVLGKDMLTTVRENAYLLYNIFYASLGLALTLSLVYELRKGAKDVNRIKQLLLLSGVLTLVFLSKLGHERLSNAMYLAGLIGVVIYGLYTARRGMKNRDYQQPKVISCLLIFLSLTVISGLIYSFYLNVISVGK